MEIDRVFYESREYLDRHNPHDFQPLRVRQFFKDTISDKNFILSLGCGKGVEDGELIEQGKKIVGIDISHGMLMDARKFCISARYLQANSMQLPFKSDTFDAIASFHMIEHVPEPKVVIKECYRVLKSGGKCLIVCPATTEYYMIPHNAAGYRIDKHIWSFSPAKLMDFYEAARFNNVQNLTGQTKLGYPDKMMDIVIIGTK